LAKTQIPAKYKTFRMGRNGPVMYTLLLG